MTCNVRTLCTVLYWHPQPRVPVEKMERGTWFGHLRYLKHPCLAPQLPNAVIVSEAGLGEPASMSMAVLKLLWEFSGQSVEEALVAGGLLIADSTEWLAGRALAWAGVPADLLLVSTGDRDLDSVQVGLQDALAQAAPQAAVAFLEAQVQALRDLTPAFLPVESESYRRRKEEESAALKARATKVSAKPEGGEAAGGRKKRVAKRPRRRRLWQRVRSRRTARQHLRRWRRRSGRGHSGRH